ncbi:MAG: beta-N-acetylhexosaminidase [Opitutales bacterium]
MRRTISSSTCRPEERRLIPGRLLLLAVGALAASALGFGAGGTGAPTLLPVPAEFSLGTGRLPVTAAFRVELQGVGEARLRAAVDRALGRWEQRTGLKFTGSGPARLVIVCDAAGATPTRLGEDESYDLNVTADGAILRAPTTLGALRGLETVLQLLVREGNGWALPVMQIRDHPRFSWRGLMIDVARHWQPPEVIRRNLDGMAVVKLNVLHLHLTDDQGFRIESRTHPELPGRGSDGHFFTQAEMRGIIAYAHERGIRVVPEFDLPGHATSWVVSHPELASQPGPYAIERRWGVFDPVFDPTNEALYPLLEDFLGEMAALFPDEYMHIGGDENNGVQWNANPRIQAYIREHGLKDNAGLHAWFNGRLSAILRRHGKRLIGWDEILHPDLPPDSVVQSWRGPEGLAAATRQGFATVLANGYYIDLNYPAADHYLNDPVPAGTALTPAQQALVLGGEATMWSEWVTPGIIDTRIWPRTAAIAERLWSPATVRDLPDLYRRLDRVDALLQEAGTRQGQWPRGNMLGLAPQDPIAQALRTLAAVVEPLKQYQRGQRQPDSTQLTPLDELADWARPESRPAREFAAALDTWLRTAGLREPVQGAALAAQLRQWGEAGRLAAQAPAAAAPVPQARRQVALMLADLGRIGAEAINAVSAGRQQSPAWAQGAAQVLEAAGKTGAAAVEFPFLASLQQLVAAAAPPPADGARKP